MCVRMVLSSGQKIMGNNHDNEHYAFKVVPNKIVQLVSVNYLPPIINSLTLDIIQKMTD